MDTDKFSRLGRSSHFRFLADVANIDVGEVKLEYCGEVKKEAGEKNRRVVYDMVLHEQRPDIQLVKQNDGNVIQALISIMQLCWHGSPASRPSMIDVCHQFAILKQTLL
ncbi:MAG: hypothetical protein Sylvanvirus7_22 [Sylvanvirus sp.]|uniref:Uncharacterized protein n=1 Tax=Sylvanvirus sp. TaxID=2487774 RepID=A0A3G5AJC2_9VIRU|nr:MAG: hypothetical protein Sylvanvirus7_22 [Sylvanvirus sp.]